MTFQHLTKEARRERVVLPEFVARRSNDFPQWIIVTCPRSDCGETFLVKRRNWYRSREEFGRSCPYCFKVGKLPKRVGRAQEA